MIHILRPAKEKMPKLIANWQSKAFTYKDVGFTKTKNTEPPQGFNLDRRRIVLGHGEQVFLKAKECVKNWKMYDVGWMDIHRPLPKIEEGAISVTFLKLCGIWFTAIPCRIIYTINEELPDKHQFGFGFGTIEGHPEKGEERFLVEWNKEDDTVHYEVYAISRSGHFLTKCGYPVMRYLQGCFFRDTQQAMLRGVKGT